VSLEERILVLTPTGRDSELVASSLRQVGITAHVCDGWATLEREIQRGAAAILMSDEALDPQSAHRLQRLLQDQPAWSDLPIMMLIGRSADSQAIRAAAQSIGNVTLLEYPRHRRPLLSPSPIPTESNSSESTPELRGWYAQ
jgi:DNA-binding response OmpR family regulator